MIVSSLTRLIFRELFLFQLKPFKSRPMLPSFGLTTWAVVTCVVGRHGYKSWSCRTLWGLLNKSNRGLTPIRRREWVRVPVRQVAKAVAALAAATSTLAPAARADSGAGVIQDGGKKRA